MRKKLSIWLILLIMMISIPIYFLMFQNGKMYRILNPSLVTYEYSEELQYGISECSVKNGSFVFSGYLLFPEHSQYMNLFNKQVWIKNSDSNKIYALKTDAYLTPDLKLDGDTTSYKNAGIMVNINIKDIPLGQYQIILCYQLDGENFIVDTNEYITI